MGWKSPEGYIAPQPALCPKCGHEVREHQPAFGSRRTSGTWNQYSGCSVCDCLLSEFEKIRAWGR